MKRESLGHTKYDQWRSFAALALEFTYIIMRSPAAYMRVEPPTLVIVSFFFYTYVYLTNANFANANGSLVDIIPKESG